MTPIRLLIYLRAMCLDPALTIAQIKSRLADVKTSALINPNSPERAHDVGYMCDRITALIVEMEGVVPPFPPADIKDLIVGRVKAAGFND